ncbi:hypothetical protein ACFXKS_37685 [Streptomyces scopuliridis]|uniref:DUF7134 domain-containing protein n=1 Tax=Streptomyces scopuliridis TaxID=452529 RepID=UPI003689D885
MVLLSSVCGGRLSSRAADVAMTHLVTAVVVVSTLVQMASGSEPPVRAAISWVLIGIGCGALYFRRRRPVTVAVITLLACGIYYPVSVTDGPALAAFALALYTLAAEGHFTVSVALAAATLLAVGFGEVVINSGHRQIDDVSVAMLAGWLISLVAIGRAQRTRLAYLHEAEQRALAAEREQEARAAERHRGTAADRPRTPRHPGPQHFADQCPVERDAAPAEQEAGDSGRARRR